MTGTANKSTCRNCTNSSVARRTTQVRSVWPGRRVSCLLSSTTEPRHHRPEVRGGWQTLVIQRKAGGAVAVVREAKGQDRCWCGEFVDGPTGQPWGLRHCSGDLGTSRLPCLLGWDCGEFPCRAGGQELGRRLRPGANKYTGDGRTTYLWTGPTSERELCQTMNAPGRCSRCCMAVEVLNLTASLPWQK